MPKWNDLYLQLKQRKVVRTGILYVAFFWGAVEVTDLLAGANMISETLVRWFVLGSVLGFPIVLSFSWFYEAPWKQRKWSSVIGDVSVILAIAIAVLLMTWQQLFSSFTRPVIAIIPIEATDTRSDTADLAIHLSNRFRMLLAMTDEIKVIELASSQSSLLSDLPIKAKATALGADFIITGTVNQGNAGLRLNVQLYSSSGELLWSERFNNRLIDMAQLQNHVFIEMQPYLPLSNKAFKTINQLVMQCEYPANVDAIRTILKVDALHSDTFEEQLEELSSLIEQNQDNGLLHLARAIINFNYIKSAQPGRKSVLHNVAMLDLDRAAGYCPAHPEILALSLYNTLQLQAQADGQSSFLALLPNESRLRLQLAEKHKQAGELEIALVFAADAWSLDPLNLDTLCFYRQLLQSRQQSFEDLYENNLYVIALKLGTECG